MRNRPIIPGSARFGGRFLQLLAWLLCALALWLGSGSVKAADSVSINTLSPTTFYIATTTGGGDPLQKAMYVGCQIVNTGSALSNVWVTIGGFSGGMVSLSTYAVGTNNLGSLAVSEAKSAYFYLKASGATTTPQSYTIKAYKGHPSANILLQSATYTFTSVFECINANANKVTGASSSPAQISIGGILTVTTTGESGTIGSSMELDFNPAVLTTWRADLFELYESRITIFGNTYSNVLHVVAPTTPNAAYTAVFKFRAIGTTAATTRMSPVNYIASGTQMKYSGNAGSFFVDLLPPVNTTLIESKGVNTNKLYYPGIATYSIGLWNTNLTDTNIFDRFVDTLPATPATVTYVAGSSTYNGALIGDPTQVGNVLTWGGMFAVGPNAHKALNYQITFPAVNGVYTNSAVVFVGDQQIDTTLDTTDNKPATTNVTMQLVTLSGKVFEDFNYGGGLGRSYSTAGSGASGRPSARVEVYNLLGNFITFTNTDSSGNYTVYVPGGTTNFIRVVNSSVTSSRSGATTGLLPVQTFTSDNSSGSVLAITDRVGGEWPNLTDARAGAPGDSFTTLTNATTVIQTICTNIVGTNSFTGIDFGFNFDTIVNTNSAGQGSLASFLTNAITLGGDSSLAQSGSYKDASNANATLPSAKETSIFMISDGASHPGLRAGLPNQLTGGVAVIAPTTALPAITGGNAPNTVIDGTTQTVNVGDSNSGQLGAGGNVGTQGTTLNKVYKPEVQLVDGNSLALGLDIQSSTITVRGLAIYGFGNAVASDANGNIRVGNNYTGTLIERNVIGTTATSFADPGASRSGGDNIRIAGGDSGTITNNLVGFSAGQGVGISTGSTGWQINGNEIRGNGIGNVTYGGVGIDGATDTLDSNLIAANQGAGVDMISTSGSNTIQRNTITGNGAGSSVTAGVRVYGSANSVYRNSLYSNTGAGILVTSSASNNLLSENSTYSNSTIGIDLLASGDNQSTGTSTYVTLNDSGDSDTGANGLLNYPILESAVVTNGNLIIKGFARSGSVIELFVSDGDSSNFGEGQTYLTTLTEGSGQDADSTSGSYSGTVNGISQGSDTTTRFSFTIAAPGGISNGAKITATAYISGTGTSEFSGYVVAEVSGVDVSGYVYSDANANGFKDTGEAGTGLTLYAKIMLATAPSGPATQAVAVDPSTGLYTFNSIAPGTYIILVDNNTTLSDVTPTIPSAWTGKEQPNQIRNNVVVAGVAQVNQNFGLMNVQSVTGLVFTDNGVSSGTPNDGIKNGGEAGLPGVTVKLMDSGSTVYDTVVTDGSGSFTLLIPNSVANGATLKIVEVNLAQYESTGASVGTTAGTYARATDTISFTHVAGSNQSGVQLGDVPVPVFLTDGRQNALPGSVVFYAHTFIAGTGGQVAFTTATTDTPSIAGWSVVLYLDVNGDAQIDSGDTVINGPITTTAGQKIIILCKVFVPANAPFNAQDLLTTTATFTYVNASPSLTAASSHTDLTTVGNPTTAGLVLVKAVDKATALPGATLTYTITYRNDSSGTLSNVIIYDDTPAYTTFMSAGNGTLPTGITGVAITAPSVGATGGIRWTFTGTLPSAGTGTVTFQVKIQ